jgi:sugar phosphate permease
MIIYFTQYDKVNTAMVANWWPEKTNRGLTFGIWSSHQYIGEILAAVASYCILHSGLDYRW